MGLDFRSVVTVDSPTCFWLYIMLMMNTAGWGEAADIQLWVLDVSFASLKTFSLLRDIRLGVYNQIIIMLSGCSVLLYSEKMGQEKVGVDVRICVILSRGVVDTLSVIHALQILLKTGNPTLSLCHGDRKTSLDLLLLWPAAQIQETYISVQFCNITSCLY